MFSSNKKPKKKTKKVAPGSPAAGHASAPRAVEKLRSKAPPPSKDAAAEKEPRPASKCTSTLGEHLSFEGSLEFTGTVMIDCDFRGNILTEDTLVVGVAGNVEAEVTAGVVEVSGVVHGNIRASSNVKIYSGGEVHGNIETPTISMEEGVIFEGNCTRPGKPQAAPQAPAPAQKAQSQSSNVEVDPQTGRKKMIVSAADLADFS